MAINKIAKIPLETNAYYQALTKLNVSFWTQDKGTSTLQFIITRNNFPIALTGEDVKVILALESEGSFISTDELDLDNEVEGVATYTIPSTFLAVAKNVTGQIYVAVGDDETVVQRKFSFKVENDLLSEIPSEEKIRYIKMFDDLKVDMEARLGTLDTALSRLEDNIEDVNNARETGITAINNLYNTKLVTFNQNFDDKVALVNGAIEDLEEYATVTLSDMTTKKEAFDASVAGSGLITTGQTDNWQKYKLTNEDGHTGSSIDLASNTSNIWALNSGFFYVTNTPISEVSVAGYLTLTSKASNMKKAYYTPYNGNQLFIKSLISGEESEWSQVALSNPSDPFETVGGSSAKANVAENNAKVYADSKVDEQHNILFSGSVNGVGQTVNLTGNMNDYEYIIISGDCAGNDFSQIMVPSIIGSIFNMQNLNLRDSDGMFLGAYEVRLETTSTTIKITNDVSYDNPSDTGSGPNRNAYTITRVEGVHKK